MRHLNEKAEKVEKPGLELCEIKKNISKRQPIPNVTREAGEMLIIGSMVLVKWPSYWPAKITNIIKNFANVTFFGDAGYMTIFCVLFTTFTIVLFFCF